MSGLAALARVTRRRMLPATGCLAALLVSAACGSTVQARSVLGNGTSGDAMGGQSDSSSHGGSAGPSADLGRAGTTVSQGDVATTGEPTGGPNGASSAASDLGSDADAGRGTPRVGSPIEVGVITAGNFDTTLKALGVNASTGDQRAQVRIIVNYLNSHGGVAGHPIRPVYYDTDTSASQQVNGQAACAAFTEDNHAVAAIGVAAQDDTYHACADQHGLIVLSDNDVKSSSFHRRYPTSISISEMAVDRKYRDMVFALKDMGFFPPGAKVGLVYTDERNDVEGVRQGMKPALSSIGITPTDEVALSMTDSGQYYSQMSAAILNFRAAGITHVLFGFAAAWTFAEAADKQGYYPKMGIDSRQAPGLFMQTVNDQRSLSNTYGVGYLPIADVDAARDPGPVTSRAKLCSKLFDDAGQGFGTDRLAASSALVLCDELFFLKDAFDGAPDLSRASFLRGVAGLGSRYQSTLTFASRFSAAQHDGPQAYRPLRYKAPCRCFEYVGPVTLFR